MLYRKAIQKIRLCFETFKIVNANVWSRSAGLHQVRLSFLMPSIGLLWVLFFVNVSLARPGMLDPNFGTNGVVTTSISSFADHTRRLQIQPDGKILVLASNSLSGTGAPAGAAIHRFLPNGDYDETFAWRGKLSIGGLRDFDLLPDGRILTVATIYDYPTHGQICRWMINGEIDLTFGLNGCVGVTGGSRFETRRIRLQTDGKIIVAGPTNSGTTLFARLHADGGPDTSFGNAGYAAGPGGDFDFYSIGPWVLDKMGALEVQPDGKILYGFSSDWAHHFIVCRLRDDGTIDTEFGNSGEVVIPIWVTGYYYDGFSFDIAITSEVTIFATGTALEWWGANSFVSVAKLESDGTFDTGFGIGGIVGLQSSETRGPASAMEFLVNDKVLLAGMDDGVFSLLRLNSDGSFDTRFGTNGIIQTPFGSSNITSILATKLLPDGSLIAAGSIEGQAPEAKIGLVKYRNVAAIGSTNYDFDGDGRADPSVFRTSDRTWYVNGSTSGFFATPFGLSTDAITPADFDGDGKTDIGVFRDGTWYWLNSSNGQFAVRHFGQHQDVPVSGDFTGDGRADLAVFRNGVWWIQDVSTNQVTVTSFGIASDKPVVGDYDGDGRSDIAIFRGGEWHLNASSGGYTVVRFGVGSDVPLIGDFDGDGRTDPAVYRAGIWHIYGSATGYSQFQFGHATDIPVPADYDGDGKADPAIYRNGDWWVFQSSSQSVAVTHFGLNDDRPIPYRTETH